mgnify:CR=1 FL=1
MYRINQANLLVLALPVLCGSCLDSGVSPVANPVAKPRITVRASSYFVSDRVQFDIWNDQEEPIYISYCNNRYCYTLEQRDSTGGWFIRDKWPVTDCDPRYSSGIIELNGGKNTNESLIMYWPGIFRILIIYSTSPALSDSNRIYSNEFIARYVNAGAP